MSGTATPCLVAPPPLGRCPPGPDIEGPLWGGHQTWRCSPPWAQWCTITAYLVPPPCFTLGQQVGFITEGGTAMGARGAPPYLSKEEGKWGLGQGGIATPYPVPPSPLSNDQLAVGRPLEFDRWGTITPCPVTALPYPVPS